MAQANLLGEGSVPLRDGSGDPPLFGGKSLPMVPPNRSRATRSTDNRTTDRVLFQLVHKNRRLLPSHQQSSLVSTKAISATAASTCTGGAFVPQLSASRGGPQRYSCSPTAVNAPVVHSTSVHPVFEPLDKKKPNNNLPSSIANSAKPRSELSEGRCLDFFPGGETAHPIDVRQEEMCVVRRQRQASEAELHTALLERDRLLAELKADGYVVEGGNHSPARRDTGAAGGCSPKTVERRPQGQSPTRVGRWLLDLKRGRQ